MRDSAFGKGSDKRTQHVCAPRPLKGGFDGVKCSIFCVLLDDFVSNVGKTNGVADMLHFGPNTQSC